jgi:Uma2 family endonuclease
MTSIQIALPLETREEQVIPMSYEDYLTAFEDSRRVEWVDGKAIVFAPPTVRHQEVVLFLAALIGVFVQRERIGKLLMGPFEMRLIPGRCSREPDLVVVTQEHRERITDQPPRRTSPILGA